MDEFKLSLGFYSETKKAMTHGSWCSAIRENFPIPLLNILYHDVSLRLTNQTADDNLWIVYAQIKSHDLRRLLVTRTMVAKLGTNEICIFSNGMASHRYTTYLPEDTNIYLPALDIDNTDILNRQRTLIRTFAIQEELMVVTWHPNRMRRWCLEYDDEFVDASERVFTCELRPIVHWEPDNTVCCNGPGVQKCGIILMLLGLVYHLVRRSRLGLRK